MRATIPTWLRHVRSVLAVVLPCAPLAIRAAVPDVGVAVLHSAPWSPNDAVRDGAGEFEVLLCVARLQHDHRVAGVVSVGDRNGTRESGGELALRRAVLTGVPVVKLAERGKVAADPDRLFLDAGRLTAEQASHVLQHCLEAFGAPPAAANPDRPTKKELVAIRAHLQRYQAALAVENRSMLAMQ